MTQQDLSTSTADPLSPLGRQLLAINIQQAYTRLVVGGDGNLEARQLLLSATPEKLIVGRVQSLDDARAMLSGLWLYHDWLDESHRIAQQIETPTGSFWHAIMHRREGDFSNSKYWYARCADHPILPALARQALDVVNPLPADNTILRLIRTGWDPPAFVDMVERIHQQPDHPHHSAAISLQQIEWRLLFDHCTRAAAGR